jgi:uncharacterized protein (TIRG00374 family)
MNRKLVTAAKIAASCLLIVVLFRRVKIAPLAAQIGHLDPALVVLLLALGALQIALFASRWQQVGIACGAPLSWRTSLRLTMIGLFFNQTLPSSIGGDAVRIWLCTRHGIPATRAASSVMVDRFVALIVLLSLGIATLPWFYELVSNPVLRHSLTAVLAVAAAGFIFLLAGGAPAAQMSHKWRATRVLAVIMGDLRSIFLRPAGAGILALSLIIHLISVAIILVIARGLHVGLDIKAGLTLFPPVLLIMTIPITIAGWGLRESAMAVALGQVHVSLPAALAISIAYGLLQILVSLPGGLLWLSRSERGTPMPVESPAN